MEPVHQLGDDVTYTGDRVLRGHAVVVDVHADGYVVDLDHFGFVSADESELLPWGVDEGALRQEDVKPGPAKSQGQPPAGNRPKPIN